MLPIYILNVVYSSCLFLLIWSFPLSPLSSCSAPPCDECRVRHVVICCCTNKTKLNWGDFLVCGKWLIPTMIGAKEADFFWSSYFLSEPWVTQTHPKCNFSFFFSSNENTSSVCSPVMFPHLYRFNYAGARKKHPERDEHGRKNLMWTVNLGV